MAEKDWTWSVEQQIFNLFEQLPLMRQSALLDRLHDYLENDDGEEIIEKEKEKEDELPILKAIEESESNPVDPEYEDIPF